MKAVQPNTSQSRKVSNDDQERQRTQKKLSTSSKELSLPDLLSAKLLHKEVRQALAASLLVMDEATLERLAAIPGLPPYFPPVKSLKNL